MRHDAHSLRKRTSKTMQMLRNAIRRVTLFGAQEGGRWSIRGYVFPDFESGGTYNEGEDDEPAEVFQGLHVYSKPANGGEALLMHVGAESDHPVLAAQRDESARLRYVEEFGDISDGDMAIHNSAGNARVIVRQDGTVIVDGSSIKLGRSASDTLIKGSTYRSAETQLFVALATAALSVTTGPVTMATMTAFADLAQAVTDFEANAASYLSSKSSTE